MKLTDTQTQILNAAAAHPTRLALPPERLPAAARQAVAKALVKAGLVTAVAEPDAAAGAAWTIDGAGTLLRITDAGLTAVGAGERPAAAASHEAPQPGAEADREPAGASTAQTAQEALQEPARAALRAVGRRPLREAASAVLTAWDCSGDHAGMDEAVAALRTALAGKPARQPRNPATPRQPREGTKQEAVLALLRRPEGATVAQIAAATGWQAHTVRGFFAGLKARQGIAVEVLERVRQVGPDRQGAKGSYSVYRIADAG